MEWVFLLGLLLAPVLVNQGPAPGLLKGRRELRELECERLDLDQAMREAPGQVRPPRERGDFLSRGALRCRQRLVPEGLRPPRDEAVLASLSATSQALAAQALASQALASQAGSPPTTWLVQAHYPDPAVGDKLRFATQAALMERGQAVSDRRPLLAPHQVEALAALPPEQAWPAACRAFSPTLGPGEVLLFVLSLDLRETAVHAGLCAEGGWTWLS